MASQANPVPEGYHSVTPYLCVKDAASAIEFYKQAFGAMESVRLTDSRGRIGHAEIKIGNSHIMLADEFPDMGFYSPQSLGGSPVTLHLYVEDVDTLTAQAVAAGAKLVRDVENQFYGDRMGMVEDSFGHVWSIATHVEDVAPEKIQQHFAALHG